MEVSKPQGLFRRGNVWYYQQRIPVDLVHSFGGKSVLKESLRTQNYAQAKILRNRVAAEFDAQFAAARATTNTTFPKTEARSTGDVLALIRNYVAREDAKGAENYASTDFAAHPGYHKASLKRIVAEVEAYKGPSNFTAS